MIKLTKIATASHAALLAKHQPLGLDEAAQAVKVF